MTTREDVTAYARTLAGLSASEPTRAAYLALIAPGETPQRAAEMALMSGCALVARAILRHFISHPLLERPYVTGHAMQDLVQIGVDARATRGALIPEPGDIVIVGGGANGGGPEHAWTCLDVVGDPYDAGAGLLVTGLDGGQLDGYGAQAIRTRERELLGGRDCTDTGARVVRWVVDVERVVGAMGR